MTRLAYLVTHPIQYQAPLLRRIAREPGVDLTVFFCSDYSVKGHVDKEFGQEVRWDVPLLEGYKHEVLPAWGSKDRVSFFRPFNHGLFRRLREGRFDALWIHGYNRFFHWIAMAQARFLGIKVLIRDEATLLSARRGPVKRAVKRLFFLVIRRLAAGFLAIGARNRAYYIHHGVPAGSLFPMPYAVDNDFFQARARESAGGREALRRELGLPPGLPVILYVGKLTARKRADDLLAAYRRLSPDGKAPPRAVLLYVGDGEMKAALERRALETGWSSIAFAGFRNQSELPAFYALADVFVFPSVREPWGLVVNEVLNAGKPVVVSDEAGCAADLVKDGVNGFLFRPGDVDGLTAALGRVLEDPARAAEMGRRGLEIVNGWDFEADVRGLKSALSATGAARG